MIYTCDRCGKDFPKRWKLTRHTERKYQCKAKAFVSEPVPASISIQISEKSALPLSKSSHKTQSQDTNLDKPLLQSSPVGESPNHIPQDSILPKSANDRKPGETVKQWGSRLRKRIKYLSLKDRGQPKNLAECKALYDELLQMDDEAYGYIEPIKQTTEEQEFFGESGIKVERQVPQPVKKIPLDPRSAIEIDQTNEEFARLSMITGDTEKSIIFREQTMGPALKRRAVAVHNAKVPRYHPDNGSDIRKMLESQRKPFQELLEKEFDKRGQFKFSLCSLTKFLVDDKPGDKEKDKKKNTRTDWLRNKQIIVYNRSEIDNYLSDAFEQIINQVEERGGKSNA